MLQFPTVRSRYGCSAIMAPACRCNIFVVKQANWKICWKLSWPLTVIRNGELGGVGCFLKPGNSPQVDALRIL